MTSSNGSIFHVTGPLWGEYTGHQWIPLSKASDAEFWWFLWTVLNQTAEQTIETPVIWDAIPDPTQYDVTVMILVTIHWFSQFQHNFDLVKWDERYGVYFYDYIFLLDITAL